MRYTSGLVKKKAASVKRKSMGTDNGDVLSYANLSWGFGPSTCIKAAEQDHGEEDWESDGDGEPDGVDAVVAI